MVPLSQIYEAVVYFIESVEDANKAEPGSAEFQAALAKLHEVVENSPEIDSKINSILASCSQRTVLLTELTEEGQEIMRALVDLGILKYEQSGEESQS